MSDRQLPGWASVARRVFRALVTLWVVLTLLGVVVRIYEWSADREVRLGLLPDGSGPYVTGVLVGLFVISGLLWLLGESISEYRKDS